jgi:hypothetical protein
VAGTSPVDADDLWREHRGRDGEVAVGLRVEPGHLGLARHVAADSPYADLALALRRGPMARDDV